MKELSWKPVRNGLIYCSPACGHSCKITEYDRAMLRAYKLANKMGGWKVYVYENLGWHYKVYSPDGMWKIHGENYGKPHYSIEFGNSGVGQLCFETASSLEAAIEKINLSIKAKISDFESMLAALKQFPLKIKGAK